MKKIEENLQKKTTITKKMTLREYLTVCWMFENMERYQIGERVDLSDCDDIELSKESKYSFRLNAEQKIAFDNFFDQFVTGKSFAAILGTVKKKGKMPGMGISSPVSASSTTIIADKNLQAAVESGEFLKRKPGVPITESCPCINAPILTDEQRWAMLSQDRVPLKKATTYDEYPFIINPNDEFSAENIDLPLLLKMFEMGKIDANEMHELTGLKYNKFFSLPLSAFSNVPAEYANEQSVASCLIAAEERYEKLKEILNEEQPPESETIERFKDYLKRYLSVVKVDDINKMSTFMDKICDVNGLQIVFETTDDDEHLTDIINYDNAEQLKNDLICIFEDYKLDWTKQINVAGKKTTVYKIIKDFYKKYPNGFEGEFFATRKDAYMAGKLAI